jgi:hypothetical protein
MQVGMPRFYKLNQRWRFTGCDGPALPEGSR